MKNLTKFTILLFIFAISITSCKKDEDEEQQEYNLAAEYFNVADATYVEAPFPTASGGAAIGTINGNHSVIPGGSNPINIQLHENIANILIGVQEIGGYYSLPATFTSLDELYQFFILMNQDLIDTEFNIVVALESINGSIGEASIIPVSLIQAGTGRLQINCSWDTETDVDLHVVEPNGTEIFFAQTNSSNGGSLDLDSNAGCGIDGVNNENITYSNDAIIENGEYIVRIDYWSNCDVTEQTHYNVIAYFEGGLITPTFGTNPYNGNFEPSDADFGASGSGLQVLKFNLVASRSQGLETKNVFKFSFPTKIDTSRFNKLDR